MLGWLLEVWTAYAHRAATYQSRVLLMLVYLFILGPAGLVARAFGARLLDAQRGPTSSWVTRPIQSDATSLVGLRRQF